MRDAFGVVKSFPRYGLIRNLKGKRRILDIKDDIVHFEEEGVASRTAHRSRVTFLPDPPKSPPQWKQQTLPFEKRDTSRISKIAMRPIYHGTSKESAKALLKGKPFTSGLKRDGVWARDGRDTIFGTTQSNKDYAQGYTYKTAKKKNGEFKLNRKGKVKVNRGTTLIYNGVGVRTTHPNNKPTHLEQNFFADELGAPVGSIRTKESIKQWAKRTTRQGNPYGSPTKR